MTSWIFVPVGLCLEAIVTWAADDTVPFSLTIAYQRATANGPRWPEQSQDESWR
jgi:hypothetical protein